MAQQEEGLPPPDTHVAMLSGECLEQVFARLSAKDLAMCMATHRQWRDFLCSEDAVWEQRAREEYGVTTLKGPDLTLQPSFRQACALWGPIWLRYGALASRAAAAWQQIDAWTEAHLPEVAQSLRPGATEAELDQVERDLQVQLPPALRVMYRFHDGQDLEFDRLLDSRRPSMCPSVFHGVLGGYSFYSHFVSTRMLPLRRMAMWTLKLAPQDANGAPLINGVLFAASFNFGKVVYCNTVTAGVEIASVDKQARLQAVPPSLPNTPPDGVLRWLSAYAERLTSGAFAVEAIYPQVGDTRGIVLYARAPPQEAEAITQGIKVLSSPLFIPELSHVEADPDEPGQWFYAYCIRMMLLSEEEQAARQVAEGVTPPRTLPSVQLRSRHWVIRNAAGEVANEITGEAVVGEYPLLTAGGPEFSYQSCTHEHQRAGSMEGDFLFVEGSLERPTGGEIRALCPPMNLTVPDIFF